jgi:hypothetical protein
MVSPRRRPTPDGGDRPTVNRYRRPASRGRVVLGAFAMLACAGFALVNVTDPSAGAVASPYYQEPTRDVPKTGVQKYKIDGGYVLVDVTRDTYTVQQAAPKVSAPTSSDSSSTASAASYGPTVPAGTAQAYAASLVAARGWGSSQFTCLVMLWDRESGWNSHAENSSSGAYGIPQALPGSKMGVGWNTDYKVQIRWGLGYIAGSYGSPCGAWNSEISRGWY